MESVTPYPPRKRAHIKALITSRSWFLAAVNGMPDHIEKK